MANTLTDLTPDLYNSLDTVSREITGLIAAVARESSLERAAKDQTIRSFVAPAATAADITPGQNAPNTGDQTFTNKTISISKSRACPIRWNGEEQRGMNTGPGYNAMFANQAAQAMRTLTNEVEADLAGLYAKASRAVDPAGTTLFDAANYKDVANVRKELVDNGAPRNDLQLVLSTASGAALRGLAQYAGADTAGNEDILRRGVLLDLHGMSIRESGEIDSHTAGSGSGYLIDNASAAIGDTTITVDTGSGTILAGDIVTIAGDSNEYVVTSALSGSTFTIAEPGLKTAVADNAAVTVQSDAERNMAFDRNAIQLVQRLPARPLEGDRAVDVMTMQDPESGLVFEVARYAEYRQVHTEISHAYGFEVIKPEHLMLLVD